MYTYAYGLIASGSVLFWHWVLPEMFDMLIDLEYLQAGGPECNLEKAILYYTGRRDSGPQPASACTAAPVAISLHTTLQAYAVLASLSRWMETEWSRTLAALQIQARGR